MRPLRPRRTVAGFRLAMPSWEILACSVLAVGLFFTFLTWRSAEENIHERTRSEFGDTIVDETVTRLREGLKVHIDALHGFEGFFAASHAIDPGEWQAYAMKLDLQHQYPGLMSLRFVQRVPVGGAETFLASAAAEVDVAALQPIADDDHFFVKYITPDNSSDFGFDVSRDPARSSAMRIACDTGGIMLTDILHSDLDRRQGVSFALLAPIFVNGMPITNQDERRRALLGYVSANFSTEKFFGLIFSESEAAGAAINIYDETSPNEPSLMYESRRRPKPGAVHVERQLVIGNRFWRISFFMPDHFGSEDSPIPILIAACGLMLSLLLFVMFLALAKARRSAVELVAARSADLRRTRQSQQAILDNIPDIAWLKDTESRYIAINEPLAKLAGRPVSEIIGLTDLDVWPKEFAEHYLEDDREVLKTGLGKRIEEEIQGSDGTRRWIETIKTPVRDDDGRVTGTAGIARDMTDRKQSERAILDAKNNYEFIINGTPALIVGISTAGTTLFINPAVEKATGYAAAEVIGKNWWTLLYPGDEYRQVEALFEAFKKGDVHDYEMTLTAKSGEKRTIAWNSINRFADSGALQEVVGFGMDVTEKKSLGRQLLHAQKMQTIGTLAGGIAHDFNNQLTPVLGYLDFLLSATPESTENYVCLTEAKQAALRCTNIVNKLMNFSRVSPEKKQPVDPARILSDCVRLFKSFLSATICISVSLPEAVWAVNANEDELQAVFMNLGVNARDAMLSGGDLALSVSNVTLTGKDAKTGHREGPYVLFTFRDTGQGISPETLSRIFEPFFTTKPKGHGTGLGLATAFSIVHSHGGWIDVSSQVGEGTVFQVYLPGLPGVSVAVSAPGGSNAVLPGGTETIIFADDEESLRKIGKFLLERLGYRVILASNGLEAVAAFEAHRGEAAVVILDMTMPVMTGREALKKILTIDPKASVILMSGFTSEGVREDFLGEGAACFLPKPFSIQPLAQALRRVLDSRLPA